MLPLCFGEATKICAYLLEADKTYRVCAKLGEATDTGDADGQQVGAAPVPALSNDDWRTILAGFTGNIRQIPPMYSALKKDGKRLYELARQGQIVQRESRPVRIHRIDFLEQNGTRLVFRVNCSKGTYVRTLVEDVARVAGTLAHTTGLHREKVGNFEAGDMLDMQSAERAAESGVDALHKHLLPAESALAHWPQVRISQSDADRFCGGQRVRLDGAGPGATGLVCVYRDDGRFTGIGEIGDDGDLAPRRVFR
jgi:tRNA pseudouridine55 synthase